MGVIKVSGQARYWIAEVLLGSPVARQIGARLVSAEPECVVLALPFARANVTLNDIVHGGVISTLIDIAGSAASSSALGDGEASGGATTNLSIHFLAPCDGCDLRAEAVVIQRGKSQTVSDVQVRDPQGGLVAKGIVTSRIFRSGGAASV